ncbi:zinc finger CCHC-type and RNA-binding motif-containing protein 1 isoform X2 [Hyalella azteca]|uniref:Zinc finger CCHC-type and RNA-binding motif-containing protein 1 isoform X2 n=1 Tax=Hyalella azteca TaxID=294128 RepID=A0A8B7NXL4_HYAAZ|nr:zinc finger CCHC-type and RNA-binding motif-containing protein 1 isoform X2 [Hyalella azteca]
MQQMMQHSSGSALAPSRSTVYISNLPFSLTNQDLHQIFDKFGKLIKVTIVRDKVTRKSMGTAFLLYLTRTEALACVSAVNKTELMGRTLTAAMAKDNGRAAEFIKRKEYPDKSRCYECGELGHLSYSCPKNALGAREPPKKKRKIKKGKIPVSKVNRTDKSKVSEKDQEDGDEDSDGDFEDESLSGAIRYSQELREAEQFLAGSREVTAAACSKSSVIKKQSYKPSSYFSDEEELE